MSTLGDHLAGKVLGPSLEAVAQRIEEEAASYRKGGSVGDKTYAEGMLHAARMVRRAKPLTK